ncbi:MAG: hypothetical protein MI824_06085 [Hyphomicrobiales bacterium]|nr:hypothetical protein [Hyphomicrobiales bacterium]
MDDGATIGWIGAIVGSLAGLAGAVFGCRASLKSARNDAQRQFLWTLIAVSTVLLVVFGVAIWLTALGVWPRWVYWLAMGLWFVGLGPAIVWGNRRLGLLAGPGQGGNGATASR